MSKKLPIKQDKKIHVKRGDTVMVLSGKDKGKTGIVKVVYLHNAKIVVEGINIKKKSVKRNPAMGVEGGFLELEAPLHSSKVMLYSHHANKPTRISMRLNPESNSKERVCKHTQNVID